MFDVMQILYVISICNSLIVWSIFLCNCQRISGRQKLIRSFVDERNDLHTSCTAHLSEPHVANCMWFFKFCAPIYRTS